MLTGRHRHSHTDSSVPRFSSAVDAQHAAGHSEPSTTKLYYVQKADMCSECPKSLIVNARAWWTQHNILGWLANLDSDLTCANVPRGVTKSLP